MLKSHVKLLFFCIFLIFLLLLNNFVYNFLSYNNLVLLLIVCLIFYKKIFGFEKDNDRFSKDIILNMSIILLLFLILYYLLGLLTGFVRTENFYTFYGFKTFLIPFVIFTMLREFFRYQIVIKIGKSKILLILICILFVLFDMTNSLNLTIFSSFRNLFNFICLTIIPSIASNVVAMQIAKKVNYKCNIFWILIFNLYNVLIPIVPATGVYISSIIKLLLPIVIFIYSYYLAHHDKKSVIKKDNKIIKFNLLSIICIVFLLIMVYLTSNIFRYFAISIASGSMQPNIYRGDVVIVDKKYKIDDLKVGNVIAYKYNSIFIVHRVVKIEKVLDEYYIYTKGDANDNWDNYIVYGNMIEGIVEFSIPVIGYPTVWLSEL